MLLNSTALTFDSEIPTKYTCDGENIIPPFEISYVPPKAESLVFLVEDPDSPTGLWTHLMVWNINPKTTKIEEGKIPNGIVGKNSAMRRDWDSINPPDGEHRYFFKLYALDTKLDLNPKTATRDELVAAMEGHILAKEEFVGKYGKKED